jgi:mono/diheme cytochrome c family protein
MPAKALTILVALRFIAIAAPLLFVGSSALMQAVQGPPEAEAGISRGKEVFASNCTSCHGADARGGSAPNTDLTRSAIVLSDKDGARIKAFLDEGRPDKGMPPFALPEAQVLDLAAYLRSIAVRQSAVSQEANASARERQRKRAS